MSGTDFHSRRFDRAAATYGAAAEVQDAMGRALIGMASGLQPGAESTFRADGMPVATGRGLRIVEMGCGTGRFSLLLRERYPGAGLWITDAAPRMLGEARRALGMPGPGGGDALLFDASGRTPAPEALRKAAPFGMAASNALVQWFPDLDRHFGSVAGLLQPGGVYLASGFLRDNFPELNSILAREPFGYTDFPGHSLEEVESAARGAFAVESLRTESLERTYADAAAFLGLIKGLGSSRRPPEGRPMTRGRLEALLAAYRRGYAVEGGVRATWKPWYALLRKI
jgi:malonyl-CoA O-methyltransferase